MNSFQKLMAFTYFEVDVENISRTELRRILQHFQEMRAFIEQIAEEPITGEHAHLVRDARRVLDLSTNGLVPMKPFS
jgi:hypothetical protein